jgi:hypothetical protein
LKGKTPLESKPALDLKLEDAADLNLPNLKDLSSNKVSSGGQDLMAALGKGKGHFKKETKIEEPVRQESKKDRFSDWED